MINRATLKSLYIKAIAVILTSTVCSAPALSAGLVPIHTGWGSTIDRVLGSTGKTPSILQELNLIERHVRLDYGQHYPYKLTGADGRNKWSEIGYRLELAMPLYAYGHGFVIQFITAEKDARGSTLSIPATSSFSLIDDASHNDLRIAHHWEKMKIRWAVSLKWVHFGTETFFDPVWELGWGEEASVRFNVGLFRQSLFNPWSWELEGQLLSARLIARLEGVRLEMGFGEPFGTRMKLLFSESEITGLPHDGQPVEFELALKGVRQGVGIYLEHSISGSNGWQIGGTHLDQNAEINLSKDNAAVAEAPVFDIVEDNWGGAVNGSLGRRIRWSTSANYHRIKGNMDGWIEPGLLPDQFARVVDGNRLFAGVGRLEGFDVKGSLGLRGKRFSTGVETGYLGLGTDVRLDDAQPDPESTIRSTHFSLSGFGICWATLNGDVSFGRLTIGAGLSQAFLVWQDFIEGQTTMEDSDLTGGRLARVWLRYRL